MSAKVPTPTTNYCLSEFHVKTKERNLYGEGGLPLHKIIPHIYEFLYNYVHIGIKDVFYYLHMILDPKDNKVPETIVLLKLKGKINIKSRREELKQYVKKLFDIMDDIFNEYFNNNISIQQRKEKKYRDDTHHKALYHSYKLWNDEIKDKITNLVNQVSTSRQKCAK